MTGRRQIRVGTSGWHYPGGAGAWDGIFYPPRGRRHRPPGFDELQYYAEHFDTVEVNSTFYGVPRRAVTAAWAARTPDDFAFSVKLHQQFTHPKMFAAATGTGDTQVDRGDVDRFRDAIAPLHESGKLGALLAQFPASFRNDTAARDHLAWLIEALSDCPVAVELRHRSWSDDVAGTLRLLNGLGAAWVQIDEPKFRLSIAQNFLPNVESFYYMRLHGRNARKWWRHDHAEERYDYHYSAPELQPFRDTADAAARLVKRLYLYMNNHFAAKSVANAATLKHHLGLDVPRRLARRDGGALPGTRRRRQDGLGGGAAAADRWTGGARVNGVQHPLVGFRNAGPSAEPAPARTHGRERCLTTGLAKYCQFVYGPVMGTMNISLPDALKSFVDQQVASRGYGTSSEYVRELIRRDRDRQRLRGLLLAGAGSAPASTADGARFDRLRERVRRQTTA